jgi:hypothetical protein
MFDNHLCSLYKRGPFTGKHFFSKYIFVRHSHFLSSQVGGGCCSVGGVRWCLWTATTNGPIVHPPDECLSMESHGGMVLTGETEELGEPVPVPLCPPQIPHGLKRARIRTSAVRGRWLIASAMARPVTGRFLLSHVILVARQLAKGEKGRTGRKELQESSRKHLLRSDRSTSLLMPLLTITVSSGWHQ